MSASVIPLFKQRDVPIDQRVDDLLQQLQEGEKLQFLSGQDLWSWRPIERLGIPAIKVTDGPHGVTCGTGDPAMSYPTGVAMASTWNTALIEEVGVALGKEMHAKGYGVLLGPAIDIQRAPLFGRNYECYSEDPVLSGKMGAAWIRGVQSQGIGTTPKHLAAYATTGFMDDVRADEQCLREIYLKPFKIVVDEADPTGMMTSYNQLNGLPTSQHPMQRDIIKAEWGFKGFLISDWRGALDIACVAAGMDIEMPGPGKIATAENLISEIDAGRLDWQRIDDSVRRILRCIIRGGYLDAEPQQWAAEENTAAQQDLARRVAEEAAVLLKNNDAVLPISTALKNIAVIGPNAASARLGGGGSAAVSPFYAVSVLEGMRKAFAHSTIHYAEGCAFKGNLPLVEAAALEALTVQYYEANDLSGALIAQQSVEQINHAWGWVSPAIGIPKNDWSVEWNGLLIPPEDGDYELALTYQDGGVRLWLNDELLIDDWQAAEGDYEAGYRDLAESISIALKSGEQHRLRIAYRKYANRAALRFEWRKPSALNPMQTAVQLAQESDAVVLCVGLSNQFEGGGARRVDMEFPGEQNELIKQVLAANRNTAVVLIGGSPLIMESWIDQAPAVVQAWYPGMEGGHALANVISGAVNPSGKLPNTTPKSYADTPSFGNEDAVDGAVHYKEGVFIGYRHYDRYQLEPRFAFGYGLSYTQFAVSDLRLSEDKKCLLYKIKNIGAYAGAEVVQVYALQHHSDQRPLRSLQAFQKTFLQVGEEQSCELILPADIQDYWCTQSASWQQQEIALQIWAGAHIIDLAY